MKMPAFEWVHVQLHQQKGMISLSPPTICNSAHASKWDTKSPALKAERLIKNHLPGDVRSHKNVWQWLVDNWNRYQ
ncbi:hypothetical protein ACWJSQ_26100 [Klebsiella pneumoniae]